jgi:putative ABC transport system permease protein
MHTPDSTLDSTAPAKRAPAGAPGRRLAFFLFSRLAVQNLGRRPTRTFLLVFAVALGSAALFATLTVARGIQASMDVGFSRMGADLMVVPRDTLVNLTSALLTAEPTGHTLPADLADTVAKIRGVSRVAPQRLYRVPTSQNGHAHEAALVAFDPQRDFCVQPWIKEKLDRPLGKGDVLLGAGREGKVGEEVTFCGQTLTVYGRLDRTSVGPFDNSFFITFETAELLAHGGGGTRPGSALPGYDPDRISALLVQLSVGATPEQVRFVVGQVPGVKVASGVSIVTSTRQGLTALFGGVFACTGLLLLGSVVLVSVLYSAIIAERHREVGLLRAVGARRGQIVRLFVAEAAMTTWLGGLCGVALGGGLLLLFQRSLGYYFQTVNVPFIWPAVHSIVICALGCALGAALVGVFGALLPALRVGRREPYDLIQAEGK